MRLLFILLGLLTVPAFAQKAIEPVRVTINAADTEAGREIARAVREELNKPGDVIITGRRADYAIQLNVAPIAGACGGYAVAVAVVEVESGKTALDAYAGATLEDVARYLVETVNREHFAPRRERRTNAKAYRH